MVARSLVFAAMAAVAVASPAGAVAAHPLHTTLTEMTVDPSRHTVRAVVRVFADDIGAALAKRTGGKVTAVADGDAVDYVRSELTVSDGALPSVSLRSCGVKRSGDLLWVCVETGPVEPRTVRVRNAVLCELFSDQVNIVQVSGAGSPRSILFTRGDGAKALL